MEHWAGFISSLWRPDAGGHGNGRSGGGAVKDVAGLGAVRADLARVVQQILGPARVPLRISPAERTGPRSERGRGASGAAERAGQVSRSHLDDGPAVYDAAEGFDRLRVVFA